jgi:hypothetical protein
MALSVNLPGAQNAAGSAGPAGAEFQFVRLIYTNSADAGGWRRNSWHTDAPEAETHLLDGIRRLTRVHAAGDSASLRLTDPAIYEHPFLYAVEVGHWYLHDDEVTVLRDYLLHGGFLMVDDFHGTEEWQIFIESMQRVFPERPIIELGDDHPAFHVQYDLDHRVQIPGIYGAMTGRTWEKDGYVPHWRGIADDDGRLMVAINFNMDLGDAWEHADNPVYPAPLTILAYHFAINYLLYAMTH